MHVSEVDMSGMCASECKYFTTVPFYCCTLVNPLLSALPYYFFDQWGVHDSEVDMSDVCVCVCMFVCACA